MSLPFGKTNKNYCQSFICESIENNRKSKGYESRHLMQIILKAQIQVQIDAKMNHEAQQNKENGKEEFSSEKQSQLKRQKSVIPNQNFNPSEMNSSIKSQHYEEILPEQNNQLIREVITKLTQKAQSVKQNLKKLNNFELNSSFSPISNHVCEYCGKIFLKPCSLGGHISKLHPQAKRIKKLTQNIDAREKSVQFQNSYEF